jgi:hypothetical protein
MACGIEIRAQVIVGDSTILQWDSPATNEDGTPLTDLGGFRVYYGSTSGVYDFSLDVGNSTQADMPNLPGGSVYYFAVTAYDISGNESAFSEEVTALYENLPGTPSAPSVPTVVPLTSTSAGLQWNPPVTNTDGTPLTDLAGFKVYYGTVSGVYSLVVDVGNSTSTEISNLQAGGTYYFAVTAYNLAGNESGYSGEATWSNVNLPNTPSAPSVPTAELLTDTSVDLQWNPPTTYADGSPLTEQVRFKVYYGTQSGVYDSIINVLSGTSTEITGLQSGTTYYFAVTTYNIAGNQSVFSEELTWAHGDAPDTPEPPPEPPPAIDVSVTLQWNPPPMNEDGTPLTDLVGFKIYYGTGSGQYGSVVDVGNASSAEISDLMAGTIYYFAMTAYNQAGNESDFSAEVVWSYGDADVDGIRDSWEQAKMSGPGIGALSSNDQDGDGFSNLQEFVFGTDPMDDQSYLPLKIRIQGGDVQVTFFAAAASGAEYADQVRVYQLERCNPSIGGWEIVAGFGRIVGQNQEFVYTVPHDDSNRCIIYRVASHLEWARGDADADGIHDAWETAQFLASGTDTDPAADADSDGLSNLDEYVLGTSPTSATSYLPVRIRIENGRPSVSFFASKATGLSYYGRIRFYRLERLDETTGAWEGVKGFERIPGLNEEVVHTVAQSATQGCSLYRAAAWLERSDGDSDKNGLQDAWEAKFLVGADSSALEDLDGDGLSNYEEFLLGTHPQNPGGFLPVDISPHNGSVQVSFIGYSADGPEYSGFTRYYRLEKCFSPDGKWTAVEGYEKVPGSDYFIVYDAPVDSGGFVLYRAKAWLDWTPGDEDGDGMLDDWELRTLSGAGSDAEPNGDSDNDGFSNLQEYVYGTDPLDGTSYFPVTIDFSSGSVNVKFYASAAEGTGYEGVQRVYRLEKLNEATGVWGQVSGFDHIIGNNTQVVYPVPANEPNCNLYRVSTSLQPI